MAHKKSPERGSFYGIQSELNGDATVSGRCRVTLLPHLTLGNMESGALLT